MILYENRGIIIDIIYKIVYSGIIKKNGVIDTEHFYLRTKNMVINKNRKANIEQSLKSISDSLDADMLIVRDCEILLMNDAAYKHIDSGQRSGTDCKRGYSDLYKDLCDSCRQNHGAEDSRQSFDIKDANGRIFSVIRNSVIWTDGKPATLLIVRDVDEERSSEAKLYNLAYVDQLTGVPNRQKLKEDFSAAETEIKSSGASGIIGIIDLDNFKAINDNYGHNTGDRMLRLITGYLEGLSEFRGHLYRLGGDEFVLFFKNSPGRFDDRTALRSYYQKLLEKALLCYTMPNIEDKCTLSMGVAMFPAHGDNLSELLRKADIALYKAKSGGRNQVLVFEDRFDSSKKFRDLFVSMQPMLLKNGNTYGYELIDSDRQQREDEDSTSLFEIDRTLDALELNDIKGSTKYFISFTNQLFNKAVLMNLPKSKFVIQIRATEKCTEDKLQIYRQLRSLGYSLALVDADLATLDRELLALADYCKFSVGGTNGSGGMRLIAANPTKTFIASDVSTLEEFEVSKRRGFTLFQGYYFSQQELTKKEKDIEPLKSNYYHLLQLTITDKYVNFNDISDVISSDVALSYKLLRLLNSAAVGLRTKVSSALMAITYLGEDNLKQWISVLALRGISNEKPLELVRMSLIRARFGEILAPTFNPPLDPRHVFMTGMLSLLHIAMDKTKEELLNEIPVADSIRDSLLGSSGPYSDLLVFFKNYERGNWEEIESFTGKYGINCTSLNYAYIEAVKWCNSLIEA